LIVTNLYHRYCPFIRYYTGDNISTSDCTGERGLLTFDSVEGRMNDVVEINGKMIHSVAFYHCIHQEKGVLNIQLVLDTQGPRLLLAGEKDPGAEARIRNRLADLSPDLRDCPIEFGHDVRTTISGKRRWIFDNRAGDRRRPARRGHGVQRP
jgi:hypothetical protein